MHTVLAQLDTAAETPGAKLATACLSNHQASCPKRLHMRPVAAPRICPIERESSQGCAQLLGQCSTADRTWMVSAAASLRADANPK
jgi:hypothetical protein